MPKRWASPLEEKSAPLLCFSWCCQCHSEPGWDGEYNLLSLPTSYSQSINSALHAVCGFQRTANRRAVLPCCYTPQRRTLPTRKSKAGQQPKAAREQAFLHWEAQKRLKCITAMNAQESTSFLHKYLQRHKQHKPKFWQPQLRSDHVWVAPQTYRLMGNSCQSCTTST